MLQLPMLGVIPRRKRPGGLPFLRPRPTLLLK
jgi:hypothetical protein